jgi:hypothetical protein
MRTGNSLSLSLLKLSNSMWLIIGAR